MAFCPNCGTQTTGAFCPNCGAAATAGAGPAAGAAYAPPAGTATTSGMSENVASALSYLFGFITGIIFLVIAPYNQNKTVRFHAFQSIFLSIAVVVVEVAWSFISLLTHGIGFLLYPILMLCFFGIWLYMMWTAYNNKKVKLPLIGDLAEKQA
ncbi:MAG TPA: hypothetical protein VFB14_26350 [Bryobacteraceae bacterium]|jgi:uncharacterized membrane protein|nr:hypothetical protein [Bryobacteraceae bacterium]